MPELPEVETVARSLINGQADEEGILHRQIVKAEVDWAKSVAIPSAKIFKKQIINQKVVGVGRRAKYIHIQLSQDALLVHLRMSGDLLLGRKNKNLGKYSRLRIYFENGQILSFNDARKFGRVWLVNDPQEIFAKLGPEPLGDELSPSDFFNNVQKRKRQLKPLLLDQSFIAGIGNIYADEALFRAKLHPLSSAHGLTRRQSNKLLSSIRYVLNEGIRRNGASIDWVYRGGEFQNDFKVYQRTGEKCLRCGEEIERIVVGQRGTHFCPNCQSKT